MKQTTTNAKLIGCLLALSLSISSIAQKTKLSLAEGQKFETQNTVKTTSSMEMMGQQMDINANVTSSRVFEIKAKKENNFGAALTITKIAMTADVMGQALSYDSEKPEDKDSDIGKGFKGKLNTPVEMDINEEGKISNLKKDEKNEAASGADEMLKSFGAAADESAIADDMFVLLPQNCKAGDTWSDSLIADGIKTYRDYSVKAIQGNEVSITISGKQNIEKKMNNNGMDMTLIMENKITGDAVVNSATNVAKQKNMVFEGTGNMEVMGQQVPMTTKVETISSTK